MPPRPQGRRPEPENNGVSKLRKIVYNINNDVVNYDNYNNNFNRSRKVNNNKANGHCYNFAWI